MKIIKAYLQPDSKKIIDIPQYLSLSILLICFSFYILKNYTIGISDHNEQIPIILRVSDSSYLLNDWFVNQTEGFSPRFFFSHFINLFIRFLSIEIIYYLLFIIFLGVTVFIIYFFVYTLFENNVVSLLTPLAILFGPRVSLGANWITGQIFVPSTIAIALISVSLYLYLINKKSISFFILGFATLFQALLGLLTAAIFSINILLCSENFSKRILDFSKYLVIYLIFGIPGLIPLILISSEISNFDVFYIITFMRHPHHYCPFSFPLKDFLLFFGMISLFILAIILNYIPKKSELHKFCIISVLSIISLGIIGTIFVEIIPITIIGKLQLFRISPLVALFSYPYIFFMIVGFISNISPISVNIKSLNVKPLIIIGAIIVSSLILIQTDITQKKTENNDLYEWVQKNTPKNATFIIPPSMENFRLRANRAVVVDWKAFPFKDSAIIEWKERINDVTHNHGNSQKYNGFSVYSQLNKNFILLNESYILFLKKKYNAQYLVMMNENELNFTELFNNSQFKVYLI